MTFTNIRLSPHFRQTPWLRWPELATAINQWWGGQTWATVIGPVVGPVLAIQTILFLSRKRNGPSPKCFSCSFSLLCILPIILFMFLAGGGGGSGRDSEGNPWPPRILAIPSRCCRLAVWSRSVAFGPAVTQTVPQIGRCLPEHRLLRPSPLGLSRWVGSFEGTPSGSCLLTTPRRTLHCSPTQGADGLSRRLRGVRMIPMRSYRVDRLLLFQLSKVLSTAAFQALSTHQPLLPPEPSLPSESSAPERKVQGKDRVPLARR